MIVLQLSLENSGFATSLISSGREFHMILDLLLALVEDSALRSEVILIVPIILAINRLMN